MNYRCIARPDGSDPKAGLDSPRQRSYIALVQRSIHFVASDGNPA
jgi:hypothetical protein